VLIFDLKGTKVFGVGEIVSHYPEGLRWCSGTQGAFFTESEAHFVVLCKAEQCLRSRERRVVSTLSNEEGGYV